MIWRWRWVSLSEGRSAQFSCTKMAKASTAVSGFLKVVGYGVGKGVQLLIAGLFV
jgi:hypothetical protein